MMRPSVRILAISTIAVTSAASLGLFAAGAASAVVAPAAARYMITDLGTLGGDMSVGKGINNDGVVVGQSITTAGGYDAFRWTAGAMLDIGIPGTSSDARAINDVGQIAGMTTRVGGGYGFPARWSATNVLQDLGGPNENSLGAGNDIDPSGRVVGGQRGISSEGSPYAIRYGVDGTPTVLGNPPESLPIATGTNARGQVVVGNSVWENGTLTPLPGLDPAYPQGVLGSAINDSSTVVGWAAVTYDSVGNASEHATVWHNGVASDLGTIASDYLVNSPAGINAAEQIVGSSARSCLGCAADDRAWLWQAGMGSLTALDTLIPADSGWLLHSANAINDKGQIVGAGMRNGQTHGYLLTPTSAPRFTAHINFGPGGAIVPHGYTTDSGAAFASRVGGLAYGWNTDNTTNTRDRHSALSPDQRYDLLIHMQRPGSANRWELAVPNGTYTVHVVSGDATCLDSNYQVAVEGRLVVSGRPSTAHRWVEGTSTVTVTDGRLTVSNARGSVNNKLNYIDVTATS